MGAAIGQVLSLGVGVALSPVPIIAVVLMLGTPAFAVPTFEALLSNFGADVVGLVTIIVLVGLGIWWLVRRSKAKARAEEALRKLEGTAFEGQALTALLAIYERTRDWALATEVGNIPVVLQKTGEDSFRLFPRASFADFLGRWLLDAMRVITEVLTGSPRPRGTAGPVRPRSWPRRRRRAWSASP